ncbi:MAG: type III pantothenate kinase [Clostridiales bacterium]|jgi:type III pantothenate kinase|nr:type III pantothenate kinase [Clostridiales bacterium]
MKILCVDIGNNLTKLCIFDIAPNNTNTLAEKFSESNYEMGKVYTLLTSKCTSESYVRTALNALNLSQIKVNSVVISCVMADALEPFTRAIQTITELTPFVVTAQTKNMLVGAPDFTGGDIIATANYIIGQNYGTPAAAFVLGTASVCINIVPQNSADGNLCGRLDGCLIWSGVNTATEALTDKCAALPEINLKKPTKFLAENTIECIENGIYYSTIGGIEHIANKFTQHNLTHQIDENHVTDTKFLISGGCANVFKDAFDNKMELVDNIVLRGLCTIFIYNGYNQNN